MLTPIPDGVLQQRGIITILSSSLHDSGVTKPSAQFPTQVKSNECNCETLPSLTHKCSLSLMRFLPADDAPHRLTTRRSSSLEHMSTSTHSLNAFVDDRRIFHNGVSVHSPTLLSSVGLTTSATELIDKNHDSHGACRSVSSVARSQAHEHSITRPKTLNVSPRTNVLLRRKTNLVQGNKKELELLPFKIVCVCSQTDDTHDCDVTDNDDGNSSCNPVAKSDALSESSKKFVNRVRSFLSYKKRPVPSGSLSADISPTTPDFSPVHLGLQLRGQSHIPLRKPRPSIRGVHNPKRLIRSPVKCLPLRSYLNSSLPICCLPPSAPEGSKICSYSPLVEFKEYVTCEDAEKVSLAAQSAILRIESELKVTTWDESKCRNLQFYLAELANLLPCAQFACEFIKDSGHEVVFHLVEVFHQFPDSHQSTIQNQSNPFVPDASVWTTLMACLAELSKYSINGSDEQDEGDEEATDYSMTLSTDGFFNTEDGRLSRPIFGATSNELFSWHLASEKFLSALIQRSWGETDLEAMRNELKVLYNILSNCPSRSETVISQTGAEFIFDLLKKAHGLSFTHRPSPIHAYGGCSLGPPCACNTPPVSPVATGESPGVTDTVAAYGTHSSDLGSPVEWWTDPLRNEVLILLLDFMYLILYRARRAGKLSTVLSRYLNCTTLRQIFSYFPQLRSHNFRDNSTTNSHYLGGMDIKKGGTLKRQSEYSNPNSSDSQTSVGRRESGGVFISLEHATHSPNTPLSGSSSRRSLSPSNVLVKLDPKELEILLALYRIQRIQLAFLADEMSTPLDRDSPSEIEKMQRLCSLAFPNVHTSLTEEQIQNAYGQLGFDVPDDPFANFEASPGRLGFRCLCAFSKKCENLMKEMLSYGRAYHRSPLAFNSFFTSYFPSSSPSKCGAKLRPSRSSVTSREAGADEPFTPLIEVTDRRSHHRRVRRRTLDSVNFASSLDDDESDQCNPLFPLASAAKALTQMLCELLGVDGTLEPLNSRGSRSHDPFVPPIYPMLFQPRTMEFSPFEELFISVFSVLFYSWTQFNAAPDDLNRVLRIVREQVIQALSRNPLSPDEFEQNLTKCTPQTVRAVWKERDDINRDRMQQSHPALTELNKDLTLAHELHVREQRMNMLAKFAPLDYTPPKLKGTQKLQVVLSPDRKSLIVRDQQQCTQAIWHLVCISRVSSGVEEKVKKNPERTIVLHVKVCDTSDQGEDWNSGSQQQSGKWRTIQPQLVARSILEYNYWLDGLFILLKNSNPSKQFVQDVQRLVDLDMKIRLASLDLTKLPRRPAPIPPDPPELDFEDS